MSNKFYKLDKDWLQLVGKNGIEYKHIVLLAVINTFAKEKGYCYASDNYLCKKMNVSRRTMQRWLELLEKNKLITRDLQRFVNKKGRIISVRRISLVESQYDVGEVCHPEWHIE